MKFEMYLSPNNLREIGLMVYKVHPDLAISCLRVIQQTKPEYTDVSLIPILFDKFCNYKGIAGITNRVATKEIIYSRHVFIAAIIKLYNPHLLTGIHSSRMRKDIRVHLSKAMRIHVTWISQNITTICFRLHIYADFEHDVDIAIQAIKQ